MPLRLSGLPLLLDLVGRTEIPTPESFTLQARGIELA
jgi:hypothetical protein